MYPLPSTLDVLSYKWIWPFHLPGVTICFSIGFLQHSPVFHPYDLACTSGCELAIRHYWSWQRPLLSSILQNFTTTPQLTWHYDDNERPDQISDVNTDNNREKDGEGEAIPPRTLRLQWQLLRNTSADNGKITQDNIDLLHWYSLLLERPFRIQYQYADAGLEEVADATPSPDKWWTLAEYNCIDHYDCRIGRGLIPYTKYRVSHRFFLLIE